MDKIKELEKKIETLEQQFGRFVDIGLGDHGACTAVEAARYIFFPYSPNHWNHYIGTKILKEAGIKQVPWMKGYYPIKDCKAIMDSVRAKYGTGQQN